MVERIGSYFLFYFLNSLRYSLGDYSIDDAAELPFRENVLYWFLWYFIVLVTVIIMLNFVIAETSKSYAEVDERLDATIMIERAGLVSEAESMIPKRIKPKEWFP